MSRRRKSLALIAVACSASLLLADNPPAPDKKMEESTRMVVIRGMSYESVFVRRPFPQGTKGLTIKDGKVTPDEAEVERMTALYGPALKPGDRARITAVRFKGDKEIYFEINNGPRKKKKWYEHIQMGVGGITPGDVTQDPGKQEEINPRGSYVELAFDKYVPEMNVDQVKKLLAPVFDFSAKSAAEAYTDTLPPQLKEAIKNHQVLVGMNREMVLYALGRPPKKYREGEGPSAYEEWIYGEPPDPVQFVRFTGDEVVRLEIMNVDGTRTIRTKKEVDMAPTVAQKQQEQKQLDDGAKLGDGTPTKAPTLRRPGEELPAAVPGSTPRTPLPPDPNGTTQPGGRPPTIPPL